jgi:hypothetical protein
MAVGGHGCDHEFGSVLIRLFRPPSLGRNSNGTIAKLAAQVGYYSFLLLFCLAFLPVLEVSTLYDNARLALRDAVTPISSALPSVSESRM